MTAKELVETLPFECWNLEPFGRNRYTFGTDAAELAVRFALTTAGATDIDIPFGVLNDADGVSLKVIFSYQDDGGAQS